MSLPPLSRGQGLILIYSTTDPCAGLYPTTSSEARAVAPALPSNENGMAQMDSQGVELVLTKRLRTLLAGL